MSLTDFINKYNGQQKIGNTTENKGECVGLVAVYIDELGLPHIWGNACDLFINADENFFEKILNTPEAIPQAGDIIVWSTKFNNTFGHTGIATGTADLRTLECFEQNDPLGSNCHLKTYPNYNYVSGWLRPKSKQNEALDACLLQHAQLVEKLNAIDAFRIAITKSLGIEGADWQRILDEVNQTIKERDDTLEQAKVGDQLWDAIVQQTGLQVVKYTTEGVKTLVEGILTLKITIPEGHRLITEEEYTQLMARKTLDRFGGWELIKEGIIKILQRG